MSITSGFFDSVSGDRTYDADQMSTYFEGLISDGVYENVGDRFLVTTGGSGMTVNVASGRAIIQAHWIKNDATEVLNLDPADMMLNRLDAIVLRLDRSARAISLTVKKGTPVSGSPALPEITRTGSVYELYIAGVLVARNSSTPTSIIDLRPSAWCGWVTGIIQQVDTSDLFTQWQTAYAAQFAAFDSYIAAKQAAFDAWFADLTGQLQVDTNIVKYQNIVYVGGGSNGAQVGIDEFDPATDVLFVFVNGRALAEEIEYVQVIAGGEPAIRLVTGDFNNGDKITFIVLKNVPGGTVIEAGNVTLGSNGVSDFVIGSAEMEEST